MQGFGELKREEKTQCTWETVNCVKRELSLLFI